MLACQAKNQVRWANVGGCTISTPLEQFPTVWLAAEGLELSWPCTVHCTSDPSSSCLVLPCLPVFPAQIPARPRGVIRQDYRNGMQKSLRCSFATRLGCSQPNFARRVGWTTNCAQLALPFDEQCLASLSAVMCALRTTRSTLALWRCVSQACVLNCPTPKTYRRPPVIKASMDLASHTADGSGPPRPPRVGTTRVQDMAS